MWTDRIMARDIKGECGYTFYSIINDVFNRYDRMSNHIPFSESKTKNRPSLVCRNSSATAKVSLM